jgi:Helix-turn-helix domain
VSIGEVLADARCRSGLSINEVSRQTRIREAVIWGIELDNYALCGGDFYARGHIRAVAQVVGVDSAPLIQEFDARRQEQEARRQAEADDVRSSMLLAPRPSSSSNVPDQPAARARPAARPGPSRSERHRRRHRRRVALSTALCLIVLAIFGVEAYHFGRDISPAKENAAQAAFNRATTGQHAKSAASKSRAKASPSPAQVTAPPTETLKPASITAYGPDGSAGDNPQDAGLAIDVHGRTAWQSDWYSTSAFGNTQSGTGLLLDLGRPVTVDSALIVIGAPGATVQLRAGTSPSDLKFIGGAKAASATTMIRPREIRVRYLLVWFTVLPPDSNGTYQAAVYNIALQGQP